MKPAIRATLILPFLLVACDEGHGPAEPMHLPTGAAALLSGGGGGTAVERST